MTDTGGQRAEKPAPSEVNFDLPLFRRVDEGVFRKSADGSAVFAVRIGETEATLSLPGIRREYSLAPNSPDGAMLDLVERALDFVGALRVGDSLPKELLTGEPSWDITDEHRMLAQHRLSLQLVALVTGEDTQTTDRARIAELAEDPETKRHVNAALGAAAQELGFGDDKVKVLALVEELGEELAPIEALRARYEELLAIRRKVAALRRLYGKELSALEIANSVARLVETAVGDFNERFAAIDAVTSEIVPALKNLNAQKKAIRARRDDLYCRLFVWDDMFARWRDAETAQSDGNLELLRATYRFLAPRYMQVDEWVLMSQLQSGAKNGKTPVNEVLDRKSGGSGKLRTEMRW